MMICIILLLIISSHCPLFSDNSRSSKGWRGRRPLEVDTSPMVTRHRTLAPEAASVVTTPRPRRPGHTRRRPGPASATSRAPRRRLSSPTWTGWAAAPGLAQLALLLTSPRPRPPARPPPGTPPLMASVVTRSPPPLYPPPGAWPATPAGPGNDQRQEYTEP